VPRKQAASARRKLTKPNACAEHTRRYHERVDDELTRLCTRERSKRLAAWGAIALFYGAGWLLFAWHASRVVETECTVAAVAGGALCTLRHERDEAPWSDCDKAPAPAGATIRCFYYASWPSYVFLEPREHRWLTPAPALVAALGVGLLAVAALRRAPRARPVAAQAPYRAPPARSRPAIAPLVVALSQPATSRWIVGGPFFVLGVALAVLTAVLGWGSGGSIGGFELALLLVAHGVLAAGVLGLFFRSRVVLDPARGTCSYAWGLVRPCFFEHVALDALAGAEAARQGAGRTTTHVLALRFADGSRWSYEMDPARAAAESERIEAFLVELRRD
jgi:hypothetical protein